MAIKKHIIQQNKIILLSLTVWSWEQAYITDGNSCFRGRFCGRTTKTDPMESICKKEKSHAACFAWRYNSRNSAVYSAGCGCCYQQWKIWSQMVSWAEKVVDVDHSCSDSTREPFWSQRKTLLDRSYSLLILWDKLQSCQRSCPLFVH